MTSSKMFSFCSWRRGQFLDRQRCHRTLVFFRREVFAFGFAKSDKANLGAAELKGYKKAAKIVLALTQAQIDTEVYQERLFEVSDGDQDLQERSVSRCP